MQTLAQARVIDPILTNHARGYKRQANIGFELFPRVWVPVAGFKVIRFGKDAYRLPNSKRAATADRQRVNFSYEADTVSMEEFSLAGEVPFKHLRDASVVPGIDKGMIAVNGVVSMVDLETEYRIATTARAAANYGADNKETVTGTDQWTNAASKPKIMIDDAKSAVRQKTGAHPNVMVVGEDAHRALCNHSVLQDQFKYTSGDSITEDMIRRYFQVDKYVVGKSVYADKNDDFVDIWADDCILAYVPEAQGGVHDVAQPSYGYTYTAEGHPYVRQPWSDDNNDTWVYPYIEENSVELTGMDAGYLMQAVV